MDAVTQYLANKGIEVNTAYFENSQFELGKRWDTNRWSLIYRVDGNTLTICDFSSKGNDAGISSAVSQLIKELKLIRRKLPSIHQIRGMIIQDAGLPDLRIKRKLLQEVLLQQGAKEVEQDDGIWLVY